MQMKFFKPEDFPQDPYVAQEIADTANNLLEVRGEVIYGFFGYNNHNEITHPDRPHMHKALLINIEEVEVADNERYK